MTVVSADFLWLLGIVLLGMMLLAAEVFVIPGTGIAGILGLSVLAGGVVWSFFLYGALGGFAVLIVSSVLVALAWWLFFATGASKRFVLRSSVPPGNMEAQHGLGPAPAALLGRVGTTVTPMRPSGSVAMGDSHFDAITDGSYLEAGVQVTVVQVEGNRVVVEAAIQ